MPTYATHNPRLLKWRHAPSWVCLHLLKHNASKNKDSQHTHFTTLSTSHHAPPEYHNSIKRVVQQSHLSITRKSPAPCEGWPASHEKQWRVHANRWVRLGSGVREECHANYETRLRYVEDVSAVISVNSVIRLVYVHDQATSYGVRLYAYNRFA